MNLYVGQTNDRYRFLNKYYGFDVYNIDRRSKNIIKTLINDISNMGTSSLFIISEGLSAYYTYYAVNYFGGNFILIDPKFFTKSGTLMTPSYKYMKDNKKSNKIILLSEDNPNLKQTIKFISDYGNKYDVVKNLNQSYLNKIIKKHVKRKTGLSDFL